MSRDMHGASDSAQNVEHSLQPLCDLQQIILCSGKGDQEVLKRLLHQSNYRAIQLHDDPGSVRTPEIASVPAIVSDTVDDPLNLCRSLAQSGPVVLVSDETGFAFRLAAARAGVSALIRRPVNPIELSEWLAHLSDQGSTGAFSVLIVDDDWLTAEVSAEVLRSAGIVVRTVSDPTLALAAIEEQTPDLVLMDMQMPGVDGVDLTRIIRQSRQFFALPIIFLSAERDETRQIAARRLGGDDFITKPIVPEKLISIVRLRADRSKLLRSMIERDRLTGLYDHTMFKERLSQELDRCCRTGAEISLVMVDIDFFKRVNDSHGHVTGDHVLRTLAGTLKSDLRRIDIVGRCGGEEFGIVFLDTGAEAAAMAVDRIRSRFSRLSFGAGETKFNVTFSAGVASSRRYQERLSDLMDAADDALYNCKRNGRNAVRIASSAVELCSFPAASKYA